jgi:hypothetical protein
MPKLALITRRKLPSLVNFLTAANKIKNNLLGEYAVQFGKTRSLDYKTPRCELYCAKLARCQAITHYIPEISHEQKHPARRKKNMYYGYVLWGYSIKDLPRKHSWSPWNERILVSS